MSDLSDWGCAVGVVLVTGVASATGAVLLAKGFTGLRPNDALVVILGFLAIVAYAVGSFVIACKWAGRFVGQPQGSLLVLAILFSGNILGSVIPRHRTAAASTSCATAEQRATPACKALGKRARSW